jgi:hypothetical protein
LTYDEEREANRAAGRVERIELVTRVPTKWRLVDLETGDVWRWATPQEREDRQMLGNLIRAHDLKATPR